MIVKKCSPSTNLNYMDGREGSRAREAMAAAQGDARDCEEAFPASERDCGREPGARARGGGGGVSQVRQQKSFQSREKPLRLSRGDGSGGGRRLEANPRRTGVEGPQARAMRARGGPAGCRDVDVARCCACPRPRRFSTPRMTADALSVWPESQESSLDGRLNGLESAIARGGYRRAEKLVASCFGSVPDCVLSADLQAGALRQMLQQRRSAVC